MGSKIPDIVRKRKGTVVKGDRIERVVPGIEGGEVRIVVRAKEGVFPINRSLARFLFNKDWNVPKVRKGKDRGS